MGNIRYLSIVLFVSFSVAVMAEGTAPLDIEKGEGFFEIIPPQPTEEADKIEVIEFFWYGCPHCYQFEPHFSTWIESLPEDVHVIKQPAIFRDNWAPGARAFFIADALDITDKVHADLFDAIQKKRNPLQTEEQMAEFFVGHGVPKEDFHATYNSFIVTTRMRQAENKSARYGVTGVPAVIVNGKYRTNGSTAKTFPQMIAIMDALIAKERANK